MLKVCKKCDVEKPFDQFYDHKDCRDGKDPTCKACKREKAKATRKPKPPRWAPVDPNATSKFCKKCNTEKSLTEFYDNQERRGGKAPYCKECTNRYMRNRYYTDPSVKQKIRARITVRKEDPEFVAKLQRNGRKHYSSVEGRARSMLRNALRSPDGCSLTLEWIIARINVGYCPVTGIIFDLSYGHQMATGRAKNPYSPSLDRINPKGPYSPENTRVVIWQYNMMKGELTDGEIAEICRRILARTTAVAV